MEILIKQQENLSQNRQCKGAFSQDENKLYLIFREYGTQNYDLYQINIINGVPDFDNSIIVNSQIIAPFPTFPTAYEILHMQLGIDGKIYMSFFFQPRLDIIENPNAIGTNCNYQQNAISLNSNTGIVPIFISNWLATNPCLDFSYLSDCSLEKTFTINNANNIQSVLWHFGDGTTSTRQNPTHTYATAGTYTVTLTVTYNDNSTQTTTKDIEVVGKPQKLVIEHE